MSQIEDIYKNLGGELPSADFTLDSSEDEDADKPQFRNYFKPQNSDGIGGHEMVDIELASKTVNVNNNQPLEENTATDNFISNHVHSSEVEEEEFKASFISENAVASIPATDAELLVGPLPDHSNDQILSMTKLEDIENFMDTLLDSKLEESSLDDTSQSVPHDAELSTAKPLTGVQLMEELYRINEKLSPSPECKSSSDHSANKKDKNEKVKKKRESVESVVPHDSHIGSAQNNSPTIFIDLRPQKPAPSDNQLGPLSPAAKKILADRHFPSCSSTNDSDDDSIEDDLIWNSYRRQIKSQSSISSSTDSQENLEAFIQDVPSLDQSTNMNIELAEGVQSWAQMLASITSSDQVLSAVVVSSSSEMDDTAGRDVLQHNGSQDKPPAISKVGKKAKVRKHAKKKKKAQATQDEKKLKGGTSKSKQKDTAVEQLEDSKLSSEVKSEDDSNTPLFVNKPDDKVEQQDQGEDVNKIKMRLEAQISARKGFGVVPSQEVIYDKDATYEPVLCQTNSATTTNALLTIELDSKGLPVVDNLPFDVELDMLKATKSWMLALFVTLATKGKSNESIHTMPFIVTGVKQTVFDGKPAIIVAISTLRDKGSDGCASENVGKWLNNTSLGQLAGMIDTEIPSVINEGVCDEDNVLSHPLSDILDFTEDTSSFFMPTSFYWEKFGRDNGSIGEAINYCDIETTIATIHHGWLGNAIFLFSVLDSVMSAGLDLAGLRLVQEPDDSHPDKPREADQLSSLPELNFILALAIRGPQAINRWAEVVGPADHELAKVTDPTSLSALFGRPEEDLMWFSRNARRAFYATAKWFGGRACIKTKTVFGINDAATKAEKRKWQKVRFADSPKSELTEPSTPTTPTIASCLFAANHSKIILTVSPKVPPSLYPLVFSACNHTGYKVFGIKRMRLNQKRARMLSLSSDDKMDNFTPSSPSKHLKESPLSPLSPLCDNAPPMPSLLVILSRENAMYHSSVLSTCLQEKLLPHLHSTGSLLVELRIAPYSDMVLSTIKSFTEIPSKPYFSSSKVSSMMGCMRDMVHLSEELSVVCFFENQIQNLGTGLDVILHCCINGASEDPVDQRENDSDKSRLLGPLELLGMKWLPKVEKHALQDLKVFEDCIECFKHGDVITKLMMNSFVVVVFRGMDANNRIKQLLMENDSLQNSLTAITTTAFAGLQLASLLFASKELFPNLEVRHLSQYLSPQLMMNCNIFQQMEDSDTSKCVSVLAVKVNAFKLFVRILEKLCRRGFRIVGLRIAKVTDEMWLNLRSTVKRSTLSSQACHCYVICFEYINAVWYLEYEVFSYIAGGQVVLDSVYWSHNYLHATRDVQFFFPNGLCCEQNSFTEDNKIFCPAIDITTYQKEVTSVDDSPLTETNCVIIPYKAMLSCDYSLASDLECLVTLKFTIVHLEAVYFSQEMTKKIFCLLSSSRKVDHFIGGTSIVIVIKRDNAASCFHSIVQQSDFSKDVVAPRSSSEASELMNLLFHDKH